MVCCQSLDCPSMSRNAWLLLAPVVTKWPMSCVCVCRQDATSWSRATSSCGRARRARASRSPATSRCWRAGSRRRSSRRSRSVVAALRAGGGAPFPSRHQNEFSQNANLCKIGENGPKFEIFVKPVLREISERRENKPQREPRLVRVAFQLGMFLRVLRPCPLNNGPRSFRILHTPSRCSS